MTKAKAKARAKKRALAKAAKPKEQKGARHDDKVRPGQFDPKNAGMRNTSGANITSPARTTRGAARSR